MVNQDKGFRDGQKDKAMEELRAKLTLEELARIKEQRKFDAIEKDTRTYKLALYLDSLKKDLRTKKATIEKRLWNIENIKNNILRCEMQISSGEIVEKLPESETIMNEVELKTYIKHQKWLMEGEVRAIPEEMAGIRGSVGHIDLMKNVIMTEEEFDQYFDEIDNRLRELGYALLY